MNPKDTDIRDDQNAEGKCFEVTEKSKPKREGKQNVVSRRRK